MRYACALLLLLSIGCMSRTQRADLTPLLARARAQGLPVSKEQLLERPTAPDDSSSEYAKFLLAGRLSGKTTNWPKTVRDYKAGELSIKEVGKLLEKDDTVHDYVRIASHSGFSPKRDYSDFQSVTLPEYQAIKLIEEVLGLRAVYAASKGNQSTAVENFRLAANVAKHAGQEKFLVSGLVDCATRVLWSWFVADAAGWLDEKHLNDLITLANSFDEPDYLDALGMEIMFVRAVADKVRKEGSRLGDRDPAYKDVKVSEADLAKSETIAIGWLVETAEKWDDANAVREISQKIDSLEDKDNAHAFAALILPRLYQFKNAELRAKAVTETTRIGLAAVKARRSRGTWPTLAEASKMAGVANADPFTGAAYGYVAEPARLLVYCYGPDGKNDFGKKANGGDNQIGDVAQFEVLLK